MKFEKELKKAYKKLPVPESGRVLPHAAEEERPARRFAFKSLVRPAVAAALLLCVVAAGVFGIASLRNDPAPGADPVNGAVGENKHAVSAVDGAREELSGHIVEPEGKLFGYYRLVEKDGKAIGGRKNVLEAGILTASEHRDTHDTEYWLGLFERDEWKLLLDKRGIYSQNIVEARVANGDSAIYNGEVTLVDASGNILYSARTDVLGRAYLFYPQQYKKDSLFAVCGNEKKPLEGLETGEYVSFDVASAGEAVKQLDLMLVVDTTGSMSDELEYLQAELEDVVKRVAAKDKQLSIRVSVNFYRDEGDDYVILPYDFTGDVSACVDRIKGQYADGGGDFPEAVDQALDNAINDHDWRDEAVKLCFIVLDAPPHSEDEVQGINSKLLSVIKTAAEKGVRVIPVASSGVDTETEAILRSFAVMTGGTYIWLTNDSGVGGYHVEAIAPEKKVEPLNDCMVRVICEFCGIKIEPSGQSGSETVFVEFLSTSDIGYAHPTGEAYISTTAGAMLHNLLKAAEFSGLDVTDSIPNYRFTFENGDVYDIKYDYAAGAEPVGVFRIGAGGKGEETGIAGVMKLCIDTILRKFHVALEPVDPPVPGDSVPDDFEFSLVWNVYGISSYDSATGRLVKTADATRPGDYVTALALEKEERERAYKILHELDLFAYPDEYDPYNDPDSETRVASSPSRTVIITFTAAGRTKTVSCKDICLGSGAAAGYDEKAKRFLAAEAELERLITSTPEWESLPEYEVFYE